MKIIDTQIKLNQTSFYNSLAMLASKLSYATDRRTASITCPDLEHAGLNLLAFEIKPDLHAKYENFSKRYEEIKKCYEANKKGLAQSMQRINNLYPNYKINSTFFENSLGFNEYKNSILFNNQEVYVYDTSSKQNINQILDNAHAFIFNTELSTSFDKLNKIATKLNDLSTKEKLNIFEKIQKKSLSKKLSKESNAEKAKQYVAIKPHKLQIIRMRNDVKSLPDENHKTLKDYLSADYSSMNEVNLEKKQLEDMLYGYIINNVLLKLISIYKNHSAYLKSYPDHPLKTFKKLIKDHFKEISLNKEVLDIVNTAVSSIDFCLDIYEQAEKNFKSQKGLYKTDWRPVMDDSIVYGIDPKNPPKNIKFQSGIPYIDISNTPFSQLSTDIQYDFYEPVEAQVMANHFE